MSNLLLLKLKHNKYTVRKNAWKYVLMNDFFIIVDSNNRVIGYAYYNNEKTNYIRVVDKNIAPDFQIRKVLGSKIDKLKPDDHYMIFVINDYKTLRKPLQLDKKVNGLRYATIDEEKEIKKRIVNELIREGNITFKDVLYTSNAYKELYTYCMEHELEEQLFNHSFCSKELNVCVNSK